MKKILMLGGSVQQIPAIEYANKQGYFTILCDYLPDNPGQNYAKRFYCVSTTDKDAVLEIGRKEKVNGVVAYASDPAAPTAAFVSEKLGLPTNPYKSVEILAYKDKFRKFLKKYNFNCPKTKTFSSFKDVSKEISKFNFPIIIKPIDSSGSKGVSKIENNKKLKQGFEKALNNSRDKKVIIEEFIEKDHDYVIGGDCFVLNGKVEFWGLLNSHRSKNVNPLVPIGTSFPLELSDQRIEKIKKEVQKIVNILNIKFGAFNLEVFVDNKDRVFIIEMGPRNGGNMIPDFLKLIYGIDLIAMTVESAMGKKNLKINYKNNYNYSYSTYVIHSSKDGIFKDIKYKNNINKKIINKVIYKKPGDKIEYFDQANKAIGILFLKFNSKREMLDVMENINNYIEIELE